MVRYTASERERAGRAVAARIRELRTSPASVARAAGVDPRTVRGLLNGTRWPTAASRESIALALDWRPGEIVRRAHGDPQLQGFTIRELLDELCRRADAWEQATSGPQVVRDGQP